MLNPPNKYSGVPSDGIKISFRMYTTATPPSNLDKWWDFGESTWVAVTAGDFADNNAPVGPAEIYDTADNIYFWKITAPLWDADNSRRYIMRVRAQDNINNYEMPKSSRVFSVDIKSPVSASVRPSPGGEYNATTNALTTLSGTSIDDLPDNVNYTRIRIFYEDDAVPYYWHSTAWVVNVSSWLMTTNLTSGGTWWSYTYGDPLNWVSGKTYYINTSAVDMANNVQVAWSTTTFQVDTQPPQVRVNIPASGSGYNLLPQITGTASDDFTGVANVQVLIQNLSNGQYWKGAIWGSGTGDDWLNYTTGDVNNWKYGAPPTISWQSGRYYMVAARGTDNAGNTTTVFSVGVNSNTFSFDHVKPNAVTILPANNSTANSLPTISGTATDDFSGVTELKLQITYLLAGDTYYWSGVEFSSETPNAEIDGKVLSPQATYTVWISTESLPAWTSPRYYRIMARAKDLATNLGSRTTVQFLFDTSPPSTVLIRPAVGIDYSPANPLPAV
ncbi:MAG: hypothetical protein QME32_08105, partial [Endomicrobiia bacterium]|nr:hypothetical protein [Endomicrobiia bacterium]